MELVMEKVRRSDFGRLSAIKIEVLENLNSIRAGAYKKIIKISFNYWRVTFSESITAS